MMQKLSVIIPTRNRGHFLGRVLEPFVSCAGEIEILVVDDGSGARAAGANRAACSQVQGCRYLRLEKPLGAPAARNLGFAVSGGSHVWFMDDDDYPTRQTIRDVLHALKEPSFRDDILLLPRNVVAQGILLRRSLPRAAVQEQKRYRSGWWDVNTSCVIFPRAVIAKIGGWDESLWAAQDTDLFWRVSQIALCRWLDTEPVYVDVGHRRRISRSLYKTQVAKLQMLKKHWPRIPLGSKIKSILYLILWAPCFKGIRLQWQLALARRRNALLLRHLPS